MSELGKALSRFLYRDLIYIIGGAGVMLSFLHYSNRLPSSTLPGPYYLFGVGLAYIVGYVTQEFFCLIGLATTTDYFEPNRLLQWLYRRFTHERWPRIERFDTIEAAREIFKEQPVAEHFERIIFHRQIGTTIGPCMLISAGWLFGRNWSLAAPQWRSFDAMLAVAALVIGATLLSMGWLKGAQQVRWMHALQQGRTTGSSGPAEAGRSA